MPVYDYICESCGPITALRPMSAHADPICCPACKQEAPRAFLQAPHMSGLSSDRRSAFERNEKSQHAPQVSTRDSRESDARDSRKRRHPIGCACCSGGSTARSRAVFTADGAKVFPSKRPWMISH
ncbi:zinc ribbon domain-containing protein [Roseibium polysiphoniae]|uniref:FmdB family zinc ribbon protein n=1 Tax=Roseibium polysiphoniae TaxID=2571221 RepID=UPI003299983C